MKQGNKINSDKEAFIKYVESYRGGESPDFCGDFDKYECYWGEELRFFLAGCNYARQQCEKEKVQVINDLRIALNEVEDLSVVIGCNSSHIKETKNRWEIK